MNPSFASLNLHWIYSIVLIAIGTLILNILITFITIKYKRKCKLLEKRYAKEL